jgi:hypothetical protein
MAPKNPKDKGQVGRTGLFLVSDRTLPWEWESFARREPRRARERLGPLKQRMLKVTSVNFGRNLSTAQSKEAAACF